MFPNYTGRLLDKLFLIAAKQTGNVRANPDDNSYLSERTAAAKATAMALFEARNELQRDRRNAEAILREKKAAEKRAEEAGKTP